MDSTSDVFSHEAIKLGAFVRALLAGFELRARARHVTLDALVFSAELRTDADMLHRLLTGLLADALQRTPAGTNVSIVVSPRGQYTEFRVADEGSGIRTGRQTKGLDCDDGTPPDSGFALSSCILAAEGQGGLLSVIETEGGTVVCLALPNEKGGTLRADEADSPTRSRSKSGIFKHSSKRAPSASPHTILVVDDEPLIRTILRRALTERGYIVLEAESAEEGLRLLSTVRVCLLVSDVQLPAASGVALVRQARQLFPGLPAVLMSASDEHSLACEGLLVGETPLFHKPFSITDLAMKLEELLLPPRAEIAQTSV